MSNKHVEPEVLGDKVVKAFERCILKFKELENVPIVLVIDRNQTIEVQRPDWQEIFLPKGLGES